MRVFALGSLFVEWLTLDSLLLCFISIISFSGIFNSYSAFHPMEDALATDIISDQQYSATENVTKSRLVPLFFLIDAPPSAYSFPIHFLFIFCVFITFIHMIFPIIYFDHICLV